jgi:hypothetical protein
MADILQFPTKKEINRVEELRELNEALDRQEEMLRDLMRELDILNEEIVACTEDYNTMLQRLKEMVLST